MKNKPIDKITLAVVLAVLCVITCLNLFQTERPTYSETEKRPLAAMPALTWENIVSGEYFDGISDGTNIVKSKPDPEVFLKAADFISVPYGDCLVVEDAIPGVEAAHAAGMKAAAVGDAAGKHVGDYILEKFSDLLNILK